MMFGLASESIRTLTRISGRPVEGLRAVFLISATVDAASSNLNLLHHLMHHCLSFDCSQPASVIKVLTAYSMCLAHQIQLCFRTLYARVGTTSGKFVSGLIGAAHIFGQSTYFVRLFCTAMHVAGAVEIVLPLMALNRGLVVADPVCQQHEECLILYLLGWFTRGHVSDEHREAARSIVVVLNTPLIGPGASSQ
jgi:hypothetical protein